MKERIAYLITGIAITAILVSVGTVTGQLQFVDAKTGTFEEVLIKGKLVIGTEGNNITLENKGDFANIIVETKGSSIMLSTENNRAIVFISSDRNKKNSLGLPDGISLMSDKTNPRKEDNAMIYLTDDKGKKTIRTTQ